jgi:hypothetical protein
MVKKIIRLRDIRIKFSFVFCTIESSVWGVIAANFFEIEKGDVE